MSERLRGFGQNKTEKLFYLAAVDAGAHVSLNPSIYSPEPVEDRFGVRRKTVTNPDFFVSFPDGRTMYVEVTKGSGRLPAKDAQMRVVQAAGVENYIQLTGDQVAQLSQPITPTEKKDLLYQFFGWDLDTHGSPFLR